MADFPGRPGVRVAADVSPVREVSLLGTADADFWRPRLAAEALEPRLLDGRAQILVLAADMKFFGVRFAELSFAVLAGVLGEGGDSAFLLGAFNSRRFFAFCERFFFSTPYEWGDVAVTAEPASARLGAAFRAAPRDLGSRPALRRGREAWDGTLHLPSRPGKPAQLFYAALEGEATAYAFSPDDVLEIGSGEGRLGEVLAALRESGFAGREWLARPAGRHVKSKTYRRPAGGA